MESGLGIRFHCKQELVSNEEFVDHHVSVLVFDCGCIGSICSMIPMVTSQMSIMCW